MSTTGPTTPPDFLYGLNHNSPSMGMTVLPSIASSRPSTGSSIQPRIVKSTIGLSQPAANGHSLTYATPDTSMSRPSTANSQGILSHPHYSPNHHHSNSGSVHSYHISPAQRQTVLENATFDGGMAISNISSYSRPSTAGSASIGTGSPSQLSAEIDMWCQPHPALAPTMHSHTGILQSTDGYYSPSLHSTPQLSRPHSPWTC